MPLAASLKHVFRRLGRTPGFTLVTLLTLAVGIGANTAIFSVVEGVLLRPLPYPRPDELVGVWHTAPGVNITDLNAAPSLYFTYKEESRAFRHIGLWRDAGATVTGLAEPERVGVLYVTDGVLPALEAQVALGRTLGAKDDEPGSPQTVLLTHGYWQSRFGGDPAAIGRRLVLDGEAREVIGVLPRDFRFLDRRVSLVVPMQFDRAKVRLGNFSYMAVARLNPGVTLEAANADVARMLPMSFDRFPAPPGFDKKMFLDARIAPNLRPWKRDLVGDVGKVLWVLMGTVGLVLLIACANVANLLLVRTEGRQQELAVRAALGASFGRIARELMVESALLGLTGGLLGMALAYGALRLLVFLAPANLPRLDEIGLHPPALGFALLASLFSSLLFGIVPVLKHAGPRIVGALRSGGRGASESRERHRARNTLVVVQVALALVLLISSGLMVRSFQALRAVKVGFAPEDVQTFRISIPEAQVKDDEDVVRLQQSLLDTVAAIPGVSAAGLITHVPMDEDGGWNDPIFAEDRAYAEGQIPPLRRFKFMSPGALEAMGTPLRAGRSFGWTEIYNRAPVVLVSENLARELWQEPGAALGHRIRETTTSRWLEIIGVVADVHQDGADQKAASIVYFPLLMQGFASNGMARSLFFVLRTPAAGTEAFMNQARKAIWSVRSELPVAQARTLESIQERSMARTSFTLVMLALAGGMALLLGVVGIYGVISYAVSQRTREIGIRMALGAPGPGLVAMFVCQGTVLAAIGAGLGLLAAFGSSRLMASLLFGVSPADPATYAAVAAGLVAAAALASYLPARRATAVDPVHALRAE